MKPLFSIPLLLALADSLGLAVRLVLIPSPPTETQFLERLAHRESPLAQARQDTLARPKPS